MLQLVAGILGFVFADKVTDKELTLNSMLQIVEKKNSSCSDVLNHFTLAFILLVQARDKVTKIINKAITHYRDDIDLQNLIDFGQREVKI